MGRWSVVLMSTPLLCAFVAEARSGDFDKFDFSLRFPAAISRFSPYADVAGAGGASSASKFQSSINPAGLSWEPLPGDARFTASPQFSTLRFSEGTALNVFVESLTAETGCCGRLLATVAQVRSHEAADRNGLDYGFDMNLGQLTWSRRFDPSWSAGAMFGYARSSTDFDAGPTPASQTHDETFSGRVGVHHLVAAGLHLGLVIDYAETPSTTDVFDVLGTGVGTVRVTDTTRQTLVRPGVAFEYAPESTLYVDYQFGRFANATGVLVVNRFFAGAEQRIVEGLFLRGGTAVDTRGNVGLTAGAGFYPTPRISVDFGFQDNFFPELEPNFGRAQSFGVSASISF